MTFLKHKNNWNNTIISPILIKKIFHKKRKHMWIKL